MSSFFSDGDARDLAYRICRDSKYRTNTREFVEGMWTRFAPYCPDDHFLVDARSHYLQRTWEMYLACVLLDRGFSLERPPPKGPDISVTNPRVWIEAIAVGPGTGSDAVLARERRGRTVDHGSGIKTWRGQPPSEESLILRVTSAVREKDAQRVRYVRDGVIKETDPFVVAVSLAAIEDALDACDTDNDMPIVVKALFGVGKEYIEVPMYSEEDPKVGFHHRPIVAKSSGAGVSAAAFAVGEYSGVSAVLCSCLSVSNVPADRGSEFVLVHNPGARAPLPAGHLPFGTEYFPQEGHLKRRRWSRRRR